MIPRCRHPRRLPDELVSPASGLLSSIFVLVSDVAAESPTGVELQIQAHPGSKWVFLGLSLRQHKQLFKIVAALNPVIVILRRLTGPPAAVQSGRARRRYRS